MALDLTKGNCLKQIIVFAIPLFIGNLFQQLYSIVDAAIVGKMVGSDALAAVGTTTPILFLLTAILAGFINGASVITAQYYGARDIHKMKASISTAFYVVMTLGTLMTFAGIFGGRTILAALRVPPDIIDNSVLYLQIFALGIPFQCLYQFLAGVLRGIGDSKTPLYFVIVACVLNVVLDVVFVLTFENGVVAVAVATLIAQAVAAISCIIYTLRKYEMLRFKLKEFVFHNNALRLIIKYGVPSSIQQIVGSLGMLFLQGLVNGFGTAAMVAFSAAFKIDNFMILPLMNLGIALSSFVGQNIGAGESNRISEGLRGCIKVSVVFCLIASAAIFIFCESLMLIFVNETDTEIIRLGADCLRALSPMFFCCGILSCYVSFFRGVGDANAAMFISMAQVAIRIAVAYTFAPVIGINAVWWCMPTTWVICSIISYIYYRTGKWKKHNPFLNELENK